MRVIITSGGTREYIDDVRVLTNISSGKLGKAVADAFSSTPHDVDYVYAKGAATPHSSRFMHEVTDVASVMRVLEDIVPKADVLIHAMAVSDFGFKRDGAVKLKSNDPQAFVDYLRDNIVINPKIISYVKKWNPNIRLVGFKFEVGKSVEELTQLALESIERNGCDIVVTNDKEEMNKAKSHIAHIVSPNGEVADVDGKKEIAKWLVNWVDSV